MDYLQKCVTQIYRALYGDAMFLGKVQNMDPSVDRFHQNMDQVHGPPIMHPVHGPPIGLFQKKIHTPPMDGKLEILAGQGGGGGGGRGLIVQEIWARGWV